MSADQLKRFIAHIDKMLSELEGKPGKARGVAGRADQGREAGQRRTPPSRRESAFPEERSRAAVPGRPGDPPGREAGVRGAPRRRHEDHELAHLAGRTRWLARLKPNKAPTLFADDPGAGVSKVRQAQGRLDQRIALLRHVEALRLYAAEHDGTAAREAVRRLRAAARRPVHRQAVPLRSHRRHGPPPRHSAAGRWKRNPVYNVHYEVTLQK